MSHPTTCLCRACTPSNNWTRAIEDSDGKLTIYNEATMEKAMEAMRNAVQMELRPTKLDRVFLYLTDAALILVAIVALAIGVVDTLPPEGVLFVWIVLGVCSYSNHKETNR